VPHDHLLLGRREGSRAAGDDQPTVGAGEGEDEPKGPCKGSGDGPDDLPPPCGVT